MKRATYLILACAVALAFTALGGSPGGRTPGQGGLRKVNTSGDFVLFDANRVKTFVRNNGSFDRDPGTGNAGYYWPSTTSNTAIYASGLWLGGKSNADGIVRVAVAEYSYEFDAGPILAGGVPADPADARYHIYKVRRGDTYGSNPDYASWPGDDGAPYVDVDGNGVFNPPQADGTGDQPLILGDLTTWCVFNEADPSVHVNMSAPPLGMEVQMTAFAFNRGDALGDVVFYKWKIINKGGHNLDSTYITVWSDPDLGDSGDDYDGCDTTLGLGFTYNGAPHDGVYGDTPPAVGFDFLQGPLVAGAPTDTARFPDGRIFPGKRLLKMTSFLKYSNDQTDLGNPGTGQEVFNYQKGLTRSGQTILAPGNIPTVFMFPGDPNNPASTSNWIETDPAGDRRFMMSAGPFLMAAGDTQEIVAASVIAQGSNNLASVTAIKQADLLVQTAYDANFSLAPPPDPPPVTFTAGDQAITLSWAEGDVNAQKALEIEATETYDPIRDLAGEGDSTYNYQGYVVYQVANAAGDNPQIVATYDIVDGVKIIRDDVFDSNVGATVNKPVKYGNDTGLRHTLRITTDKYTGQPLSNQKDYYFIVTAYTYNETSIPKTLESALIVRRIRPTKMPGGRLTSAYGDTLAVTHQAGSGDGVVVTTVVDPNRTTGHVYNVVFAFDSALAAYTWSVRDVTAGTTVVSNQVNQTGDAAYPTFDGLQAIVSGPQQPGMKSWDIVGTRRFSPVGGFIGLGLEGFASSTEPDLYDQDNGTIGMAGHLQFGGIGTTLTDGDYRNVEIRLAPVSATTLWDPLATPADANFSRAYRWLRNSANPPADPSFAPWIINTGAGYTYQDYNYSVPFSAWNMETDPPTRLMVGHLENNVVNGKVDGRYWPYNASDTVDNTVAREFLFIFNVPYSETPDPSLMINLSGSTTPMMWVMVCSRRNETDWAAGDIFKITANHLNTATDVFAFTAPAAVEVNTANLKTDLNIINAVPNPYYGANAYERNQFNRVVRFTNLPTTATIRIFNLIGDLVRTLHKDDATTSMDWDLQNENDLPIASGMYIVHVDVPGIGEKVLKIAVILSQERLDNF
jgi:hypothetical protein